MKGSQVQNGHHPTWESGFRLGKCSKAGTAERLDQMENNRETVAMSTAIKKNAEWPRALLIVAGGGMRCHSRTGSSARRRENEAVASVMRTIERRFDRTWWDGCFSTMSDYAQPSRGDSS